jgi:predicted DNA-binding ribbon-helix-helix protein
MRIQYLAKSWRQANRRKHCGVPAQARPQVGYFWRFNFSATIVEDGARIHIDRQCMSPTPGKQVMKSSIVKRSLVIAGHKTSVSLEDDFWKIFKSIADQRSVTVSELAAVVDGGRRHANLSSAIRLFVLGYYRERLSEYEQRDRAQGTLSTPMLKPDRVTAE